MDNELQQWKQIIVWDKKRMLWSKLLVVLWQINAILHLDCLSVNNRQYTSWVAFSLCLQDGTDNNATYTENVWDSKTNVYKLLRQCKESAQ